MILRPPPNALFAVLALALTTAACNGKPEQDSYTAAEESAVPTVGTTKAPMPAYPDWAGAMIGRSLKDAARPGGVCKGALDVVSSKYVGARPGVTVEGWGWDETGARPLARVLLVDPTGRIVGAGVVGALRSDVPKVVSEVKTPAVGWKGVAGVTAGELQAVGVTAAGASCTLGRLLL